MSEPPDELYKAYARIDELEACLADANRRLNVACHIQAEDKVGFDFSVLDKIRILEELYTDAVSTIKSMETLVIDMLKESLQDKKENA